jgi:hypothetical protein
MFYFMKFEFIFAPSVGCVQISSTAASWLKQEELHIAN